MMQRRIQQGESPRGDLWLIGRLLCLLSGAIAVAFIALVACAAHADIVPTYSDPGWADRLAGALAASTACDKQISLGKAGVYLYGAMDTTDEDNDLAAIMNRIRASGDFVEAVAKAMQQLRAGKIDCRTAMSLYGPNGSADPGLLTDQP